MAAAALVFGSSAAVLVVELAALRLLAPYLGLTLETSTMVIGIALAAIAVGSWAGGRPPTGPAAPADRAAARGLRGRRGADPVRGPGGRPSTAGRMLLLIVAALSIIVPGRCWPP